MPGALQTTPASQGDSTLGGIPKVAQLASNLCNNNTLVADSQRLQDVILRCQIQSMLLRNTMTASRGFPQFR